MLAKLFMNNFNKGAAIVNISSTRDRMSQPNTESYTAAKGGISALTHALAVSLAGKVRVNSISPGWIDTHGNEYHGPMLSSTPPEGWGILLTLPIWLCSLQRQGRFITGENIAVDGGMTKLMVYHNDHGWAYDAGE